MAGVMALQNFDHGGPRKRGDLFEVSDQVAKKLKARKLVVLDGDAHPLRPMKAAGAKLSALPVAQVLPQTIAKKSKNGAKRKKAAQ